MFSSIADLSHIRTQWCLADCLTKKSANPQNLIDAVRQGVLKEVDAHPPFRSLLEQGLPQAMVAYSLQSCWFQRWCISVRWHPEGFLTIFWICACNSKGSSLEDRSVFFAMSSSNRWTRASAAEAQASSSSRRRQDFPDSQYDDEERHRSLPVGYAQRKTEEVPSWFQARESLRQKRRRDTHILMGPNNMSGFDRHQMFMDVVSWILYWGSEHREIDVAIKWLGEFLQYLCGFTTQDEEDWFDERCSSFTTSTSLEDAGTRGASPYHKCWDTKKDLSLQWARQYEHCRFVWSYGLAEPKTAQHVWRTVCSISVVQSQAEIFRWHSHAVGMVSMQLSGNVSIWCEIGLCTRALESGCWPLLYTSPTDIWRSHVLGMDFLCHWFSKRTLDSPYGLKTDVKGSGQSGRDAIHFMYHNDNDEGYIRMAEGTTTSRHYRQHFVLDPEFIESRCFFPMVTFQLNFCTFKISYQRWHAMSWDLGEDTCCRPQSLGEIGQVMLVVDMFDVRRVSVLHLEVPFLKLSEQQHGSSWARRSLQTMGNLSLVFLWHQRLILIQRSGQSMVYCQTPLSRERNLNRMINLCKPIWTAIKTCRTLSAERGTCQSMGTTTFLIR